MIEETTHTARAPEYNDRFFRHLFESADETAVVLLGAEGKITGWNRGAERLLGWSAEEALGQEGAIFFTEEDRKAGAPEEELETAKEHGWADDTRWHVKKSGERFWANAVVEAVEDAEGNVVGFAKILRDRTDVKQYEKALEEKTDQLEERTEELRQSNQQLESFASYVAHEVRSPLVGASLLVDQLLDRSSKGPDVEGPGQEGLGRKDEERIRLVKSTIEDINRFVSDLLSYSRLGGKDEISREPVQARSVAEEAREDLRPILEENGAEIEIGDLPTVYANATYLRHLFRNLFSNAIKYNESEVPRVRIEEDPTEPGEEPTAWTFRVTDNGVGMSEEERKKIFDLFQRGDLQRSADGEEAGIGIGLALVRRIVEAHGGEIWAESTPGRGTTFVFTIPKAEEPSGS